MIFLPINLLTVKTIMINAEIMVILTINFSGITESLLVQKIAT